ncbi:MAG: YciI family protein [Bradyrhizobium sp.]|uniref:YciI family protein n=1 Tax=Bradyrhizobium sp. TaxID=376 RepID=UPI003D0F6403
MLYAILAYHVEAEVMSWSAEEDAALMANLRKAHERLDQVGRLGPAARLGETARARTLRGPGDGTILDGPFAETKEQLLGFYVVDFPDEDAAFDAVHHLRRANPSAVYEVRPIRLFIPGHAFAETAAEN